MVYWNARSLNNKTKCVYDYLSSNECDLFSLTETWLSKGVSPDLNPNRVTLAGALPEGYMLEHAPRKDGRKGGGVGMIYSEQINVEKQEISKKYNQFELLTISVRFKASKVNIAIVYRPSPSKKNKLKLRLFWNQWTDFLSSYTTRTQEFIILGDLNFHLDNLQNASTKKFNKILSEFGLSQHINEPTHAKGHTLDVLITSLESKVTENLTVKDLGFITDSNCPIKDHLAICFNLKGEKRAYQRKVINYRKWKGIDIELFKSEYQVLSTSFPNYSDSDQMALWYHEKITELANSYAPLITKEVIRRSNPWYTEKAKEMKRTARKLERRWKKTKLKADERILKCQRILHFYV